MKRFYAIFYARNLEFIRDKAAISWTLIMPLFLILAFTFIFSNDDKTLYKVGVIGEVNSDIAFFESKYIQFIPFHDEISAKNKLRHHKLDMLIHNKQQTDYWVNESSPNGYVVEKMLWGTGGESYLKKTIDGKEISYLDWVLPGILAFNMMMGCLFGVGYVIVRYRKSGYLKRLKATPLSPFEFLVAQMSSRLILIESVTVFVYLACFILIEFTMNGSHLLLFLVSIIGAVCMISLGLMVAARISSEELAGGLLNLITWPMMILSGVWFSLEGTNPLIQSLSQLLPLTHIVDAARAIMTEGAGLESISYNLITLLIMTAIFLLIGAKTFRWD